MLQLWLFIPLYLHGIILQQGCTQDIAWDGL